MLPQATLRAILCAVRIDFRLPPQINPYPAQPATGVLGRSPKRVLLTFARTKVSPRRVGVLIKPFIRPAPPPGVRKLFHAPAVRRPQTFPLMTPPSGTRKLFHDSLRQNPPNYKQTFAICPIMCYTKTKAKNLGKRESVPCSARCNRWA